MCCLPPDLRPKEGNIDNNAFWGVWGVYPLRKTKGTALCIKTFIFFLPCANSIDFLWVSYRLSINFL